MLAAKTSVIVVGGGPFGLMLAIELGRRGIGVLLVDEKPGTTQNVQANATQARTMEYFRRLGFADEVRALGLPPDFPTDVAYFTRFARYELARFALPSAREAKKIVTTLSGSWSAAELPHRCNQKFIEPVLRRHAEALPGVSVNYGWRMTEARQLEDRVEAVVEPSAGGARQMVTGSYLVGGDGPRSAVRQLLGARYTGESGVLRDFVGGRMYAIHTRIPDYYRIVSHAPAWMNVAFNRERRSFMAAVDGKSEFAFHTQLKAHEDVERLSQADAVRMVQQAIGAEASVEVLARMTWVAGHSLVADRFSSGRIFLGGDAAHLFTPTGGLGYNTAIEDAVNLGWKLAAVLRGQASRNLLETYDLERRPLAVRNTSYARRFADSLGNFVPAAEIEEDGAAGVAARQRAGEYFAAHGKSEFDIPGITFGGRYDGSPAIISDGTPAPADKADTYVATACPGGRPPHAWLSERESLFDRFGLNWTLLRLGKPDGASIIAAAKERSLDLRVLDLDLPAIREAYQSDLALIRPDQVVAWRGNEDRAAGSLFLQLTGRD